MNGVDCHVDYRITQILSFVFIVKKKDNSKDIAAAFVSNGHNGEELASAANQKKHQGQIWPQTQQRDHGVAYTVSETTMEKTKTNVRIEVLVALILVNQPQVPLLLAGDQQSATIAASFTIRMTTHCRIVSAALRKHVNYVIKHFMAMAIKFVTLE